MGDIKILFHPVKKCYRVLMRREQVLKVCANHTISKSIELKPMNTSANALVWTATDYSGTDLTPHLLETVLAVLFTRVCFHKQRETGRSSSSRPSSRLQRSPSPSDERSSTARASCRGPTALRCPWPRRFHETPTPWCTSTWGSTASLLGESSWSCSLTSFPKRQRTSGLCARARRASVSTAPSSTGSSLTSCVR